MHHHLGSLSDIAEIDPEVNLIASDNDKKPVRAVFLNSRLRRHEEKSPKLYLKRFNYSKAASRVPESQGIEPTLQPISSGEVYDITRDIVSRETSKIIIPQQEIRNESFDIFYDDFEKSPYETDVEFLKNVDSFQMIWEKNSEEAKNIARGILDEVLQNMAIRFEEPSLDTTHPPIQIVDQEPSLDTRHPPIEMVDEEVNEAVRSLLDDVLKKIPEHFEEPNLDHEHPTSQMVDDVGTDKSLNRNAGDGKSSDNGFQKEVLKKSVRFKQSPTFFTFGCTNKSCPGKFKHDVVVGKTVACHTNWNKSITVTPPCNKKLQVRISNNCCCHSKAEKLDGKKTFCPASSFDSFEDVDTTSDKNSRNKKLQVKICNCVKQKDVDLKQKIQDFANTAALIFEKQAMNESDLSQILNECMRKIVKAIDRNEKKKNEPLVENISAIEKYVAEFNYLEYQANMDDVASILNRIVSTICTECCDDAICKDENDLYCERRTENHDSSVSTKKSDLCERSYSQRSLIQNIIIMRDSNVINLNGLSRNIILIMKNNINIKPL